MATSIEDVSLVVRQGYLEIFWIGDNVLRHSYVSVPSASSGVGHSNIGSVTAYGSLDAVAMNGDNFDFFAAFKGAGLELTGWRWKLGVGSGTVDITPPAEATIDLADYADSGASATDNITGVNPPAFIGTADPNSIVRIYANGELVGQGVATSEGDWEITIEPLDTKATGVLSQAVAGGAR